MRADIANKEADAAYQQGLLKHEPCKVVTVAAGAGSGFMVAAVGLMTLMVRLIGAH